MKEEEEWDEERRAPKKRSRAIANITGEEDTERYLPAASLPSHAADYPLTFQEGEEMLDKAKRERITTEVERVFWTAEKMEPFIRGEEEWWTETGEPIEPPEIMRQIAADGHLNAARKTANRPGMTLEDAFSEMFASGISCQWCPEDSKRTVLVVHGKHINGHGYGVAMYMTNERLIEKAYIELLKIGH